MKNYTEKQIFQEIDSLISSINKDYSKFGDLSDWVRKETISKLRKVKRMIKAPRIVDFKNRSKLFKMKKKKKRVRKSYGY